MIEGIRDLNFSGLEDAPKFSYRPVKRGQAIYILLKCKEEGIRATFSSGYVQIYSKKKLSEFEVIVQESLKYECKNNLNIEVDTQSFYSGESRLLGIAIKKCNTILATEESFLEVVYYQYQNKIPVTINYRIYHTQREMIKDAESRFNLIV